MEEPLLDGPWAGATFVPPTPTDIAYAESAIVQQLQWFLGQALGSGMVEVAHFPDRAKAYELRHGIGSVLVTYAGSTYDKIDDIGHVVQQREMLWDVAVLMRDLGWAYGGPGSGTSPGAYQVIELVLTALLGFQPHTGFTKLRAVHDRFLDRDADGGVWVYEVRFNTRTKVVEHYHIPDTPLFVRGTLMETGGQTSYQIALRLITFISDEARVERNVQSLVLKSQDLSITYTQDVDYSLDNIQGIVTRLASGAIPTGATVAVSFAYGDVVDAVAGHPFVPFAPSN